jgi:hypothetical protein
MSVFNYKLQVKARLHSDTHFSVWLGRVNIISQRYIFFVVVNILEK